MIKVSLLFFSVLTLFCYMIPGFILRKSRLVEDSFAKALSKYTLYVAQSAMLLHGFITKFDPKVFQGLCLVFVISLCIHIMFYLLAKGMFRKTPDKVRRVLQFGMIFSNAGYMGIPVINDVFGSEYTIYATIYIVWFNVLVFSLGRLIYTDDTKYIFSKKAVLNPAVIPIAIGIVIYLTGIGGYVQDAISGSGFGNHILKILYDIVTVLKNTVAPISMIVIGARLSDIKFGGVFKDKYLYPFIFIRLFFFPALVWVLLRICFALGWIDQTILSIVVILSATPAAAVTTMFAELYDGDSPYAGKLVAITTILSVISMPIVSLLLTI